MASSVTIRRLRFEDAPVIAAAFQAIGWAKTVEQYKRYAQQDEQGARDCYVAEVGSEFAGYCTLLWESKYPYFRERDIPEVSDLNVLPHFRERGIANRLMDAVEGAAAERSDSVGLGVGLYSDYGAAQRIYVRRGYIPDGQGVMYNYAPVAPGETVLIDDDATLMFVLTL